MATLIRGDKSKHKFKGKLLRTFVQPPGSTGHARRRYQFQPGTQSLRAAKRNLRNKCRTILDAKDTPTILAGRRIVNAVLHEPDAEFTFLHLACAAVDMAHDTGESWATCADYLMDQYATIAKESTDDATSASTNQRTPPQGGYIRAAFSRLFRTRDESVASRDEH